MENVKIPFFKRLKMAVINIEKYHDFVLEKPSIAWKYFIKLVLLFCMIICIVITYQYSQIMNSAIKILKDDVPEFTLENNILKTESSEPKTIEANNIGLGDVIIIIDANLDKNSEEFKEYSKKVNLYNLGLIFLKDELLLKTQITNNLQELSYSQLTSQYNIQTMTKQDAITMVENINPASMYVALYLTLLIYLFCSYLIATIIENTIIMFILGFITAKIARVRMKNSQIYTIVLYSLTLPILLNALYTVVNTLTGFEIKYFSVMFQAISYIYLITTIFMIRSDLIKQQMEIKKIEEVQQEVKKEIEDKKDEEEKKETEDEKKEENDENKDVGTDGGEPEGTA